MAVSGYPIVALVGYMYSDRSMAMWLFAILLQDDIDRPLIVSLQAAYGPNAVTMP